MFGLMCWFIGANVLRRICLATLAATETNGKEKLLCPIWMWGLIWLLDAVLVGREVKVFGDHVNGWMVVVVCCKVKSFFFIRNWVLGLQMK